MLMVITSGSSMSAFQTDQRAFFLGQLGGPSMEKLSHRFAAKFVECTLSSPWSEPGFARRGQGGGRGDKGDLGVSTLYRRLDNSKSSRGGWTTYRCCWRSGPSCSGQEAPDD